MDLPGLEDLLTSFTVAIRGQIKAEKTLRRVAELADLADRDGLDISSADIRIAINLEEQ